jgi:alcohol dehydrogenase class IV
MTTMFNVPSTIIIDGGASAEVGIQVKRFKALKALLVTDAFMVDCGLAGKISDTIKKEGIDVEIFSGVQPDPTDLNVREGLDVFQKTNCQVIVGLGGGSSMDCAKMISVMTANEEPLRQYAGLHKVVNKGVPVIVIPTTAGTGAEVTKVVVIGDTERDVKMMMLDLNIMADVALVDYELTMTCTPSLTANVGVDTLVHAVEAYVSKKSNPMTDPIALSAIHLVSRHLLNAFKEPNNTEAREGMMLAALQGGISFSNSSVCLVHGMSRPIGALYHVPHGLSNAVLFPDVTEFSISGASERYATVARTMGLASEKDSNDAACKALVKGLKKLNKDLHVPRLSDVVEVDWAAFYQKVEKMANDSIDSGSPANNPVVPTAEQIIEIYHAAW